MERGLRLSIRIGLGDPLKSAPTARWKGDCDVPRLPYHLNARGKVGADGPMERGLRLPVHPLQRRQDKMSAPTARWKGDCDASLVGAGIATAPRRRRRPDGKGIATSAMRRARSRSHSRRRRPDGKGIATRDGERKLSPSPRVGADGPMERGLRHLHVASHCGGSTWSAPTARWKGDCDP